MREWINPTGGSVRAVDKQGSGKFGAPRGGRVHTGTDYSGTPGQDVFAVTDGKLDRIGFCYEDDLTYRLIVILTAEGHTVRHLYVQPIDGLEIGWAVKHGEKIGTLQALHTKYPGITNHVHIDIHWNGNFMNPEHLIE